MNIQDIRKHNLEALITQHGPGLDAASEAMDLSANYLSQLRSGHRSMGHQSARKVERALRLPVHWMDALHEPQLATARPPASPEAEAEADQLFELLLKTHELAMRGEIRDSYRTLLTQTLHHVCENARDDYLPQPRSAMRSEAPKIQKKATGEG